MPLILPPGLPAIQALHRENIPTLPPQEAARQPMRPLEVLVVNLMPEKIATETQLARVLSGSPLPVRLTLMRTQSHASAHAPPQHMAAFYHTLGQLGHRRFDGAIVTGAPIERLDYPLVDYWAEFLDILAFVRQNARSTLYLCWAAMAALWHTYGIPKHPLAQKLHGVFEHRALAPQHPLLRGLDEVFYVPHSRQAEIRRADVEKIPALHILAESDEAGLHAVASADGSEVYLFGHMEYERDTLWREYERDAAGRPPLPRHYFVDDDPARGVLFRWRGAGHLFYTNWLHHSLYRPWLAGLPPCVPSMALAMTGPV